MRRKRVLRGLPSWLFAELKWWVSQPAEYVRCFDRELHLKQVVYLNPMYNYAPKSGR